MNSARWQIVRSLLWALPVAGFALWWYSRPYQWVGILIAVLAGGFTFLIINAKRKMGYQRPLFIMLFLIFIGTILSIVYVNNTSVAFLDWAARHTIAYYRVGESLRSTVFPCTLTISQVFLGRAATFNPSLGSWMTVFPPSLRAFVMILIPFVATTIIFGRGICGWICPFGGLPEAMVTGKKERWQLGFLTKTTDTGTKREYGGLKEWVKDLKYGMLLGGLLLAVFLVFPVVCLLCPVLWLSSLPVFWSVIGLMVLFALILPFMTKKRWWCQICPLGAVFAMLDKVSLFRVRLDTKRCDRCMDCVYECRMYALEPVALDKKGVPNEDCIRCGRCIETCPEQAADMYFMNTRLKARNAFMSLSVVAVLAWYIWFVYILYGKLLG
jgi:polyferredoxin